MRLGVIKELRPELIATHQGKREYVFTTCVCVWGG